MTTALMARPLLDTVRQAVETAQLHEWPYDEIYLHADYAKNIVEEAKTVVGHYGNGCSLELFGYRLRFSKHIGRNEIVFHSAHHAMMKRVQVTEDRDLDLAVRGGAVLR